jgi:transposase-like protein
LEAIRWPNGPVCPHCKNTDAKKIWKIQPNEAKKIRAGLYHCAECNGQFTVTVKTIFEDSHIPLRKWLVAWYLICSSKKGISAVQIQRSLGLGSYRTAWMMMHKIRHAMKDPAFNAPLDGTVECDETFVGGKPRPGAEASKDSGYRKGSKKVPVVALVQRDGNVRTKVVANVTQKNLRLFLATNASQNAILNTDQNNMYKPIGKSWERHDVVNHSDKEYARHNADGTVSHVNSCESFFSLLKRGVMGAFHHVSKEHLHRYCDEFSFRWNHRSVTDGERMVSGLQKSEGKRITYKPLING